MRKSLFVFISVSTILASGAAFADGIVFPKVPRVTAETSLADGIVFPKVPRVTADAIVA